MATFRPSPQQMAIRDWVLRGRGSLNINAFAGCGKTSTLIYLIPDLNGEVFFGAYNRAIANEIAAKVEKACLTRRGLDISTMHAAGFRAWRSVNRGCNVDGDKVKCIINNLAENQDVYAKYFTFIQKAVSLAKQRCFGVLCPTDSQQAWEDLIDHFGLEEELENGDSYSLGDLITMARTVLEASDKTDSTVVDFDDMIRAPLLHKVRLWQRDWVLLDEAQDTNPARRALALAMLKPRGRLIAVGDRFQAIYGFTGADSDAMDLIKIQLNSAELPLSITYRCPKSVVTVANQWVPGIQAAATAPEGNVRTVYLAPKSGQPGFWDESLVKEDAILCRNTAPLLEIAFQLIRKGTPCRVEGRDIGMGLIALCKKWKAHNLNALRQRLDSWAEKQTQRFKAKGREDLAALVEDKAETLRVLMDKCQMEGHTTVDALEKLILSMFGDSTQGEPPRLLTLATVHKSKGREWGRVYLLGRNAYMPSKWARSEWQMAQEQNLMYVSVTRAMNELVEIHVPPKPKSKRRGEGG